ncbi:MAG TPA: twin-arginine translocase subunit TatC [Acidimicrobiales bacterium]|nr:twin-arginine translocase subunit TatC [Acidimicrobiales bacterium]
MADEAATTAATADELAAMTLVEHLTELRTRLFISVLAVAIGAVVAFTLYERILDFLVDPYCEIQHGNCKLFVQSPLDGLATRLKIAGYGGLMISSPVVLWEIWRFITPGLHKREKRYAIPFIMASTGLFFLGVFLAYLTFPKALDFLIEIGGADLEQIFSPKEYVSFFLKIMLAFGLAFEFPVVLVFLELVRVLSSAKLRSWRRPAIVIIVAAAAVITPSQDPYSLLAMAVPMYVFYEVSIIVGRLLKR